MKRFWNQSSEVRALIASSFLTLLGFCGTVFLFWLHRYDIPLAIAIGGFIVTLSWLALYFASKANKKSVKLEIAFIYIRLGVVVALALTFALISYNLSIVIASPLFLVVSYLIISLLTMLVFIRKGE